MRRMMASRRASFAARLWHADRGVAAIEAAIILPLMLAFLLGMIEIYQYARVRNIMDRATFTVAQSMALQRGLSGDGQGACDAPDRVCTYGALLPSLMRPIHYDGRLAIRLYKADSSGQWDPSPAGDWSFSGQNGCGTLPQGDALPGGMPSAAPYDRMLVVQLCQAYQPLFMPSQFWAGLGGEDLTTTVFYRPLFHLMDD